MSSLMDKAVPAGRRAAAQRALRQTARELLSDCEVEFFSAGGPGGQHRNKTATGVRLTHRPTELSVTATERRSQSQNRSVAFSRLISGLRQLAKEPKVRRRTGPSSTAKKRRLEEKRRLSAKKQLRRRDFS